MFIINQGSYGTKGGLVIGTRLLFVGVITSTMLRTEAIGNAYLGLGRVVKSSAVKSAIELFASSVSK